MTLDFLHTAHTDLYNNAYLPLTRSSAAARVDQLRAIAASDYSVSHRLREMLLTRILCGACVEALPEEIPVFEQLLCEGQRMGTLWTMNSAAVARALVAATNGLSPSDTATQVVDLLLQGLVRTSLPANWVCESAAA